MEPEADKEVTPDSLEDMVRSLKEGYQTNKKLLYRLEQILHMSKLPSTVRHFATVVREFFDDVMKSVLDMMGMVTELLKEYSHLIQVHYGMQMGEELRRVKDIFLLLEPQKYQPYIGMMVRDSCKIALAATSGRWTISKDYGTALVRNNLYLAKMTMRVYIREARHAKRKLHKVECEPLDLQNKMASFLSGCLRVVNLWGKRNGGELWMTPEMAMKLVREHLHEVVYLLKVLVAEIRGAHCNLSESVSCLVDTCNKHKIWS